MIINNLLRKLFTVGKSSFFRQNINNLKKTSLSKNPVGISFGKVSSQKLDRQTLDTTNPYLILSDDTLESPGRAIIRVSG